MAASKKSKKKHVTKISKVVFDDVYRMLLEGKTYRAIADFYNLDIAQFCTYLSLSQHSARVTEALRLSAQSYADKATRIIEDVVITGKPTDKMELMKARELAHHFRWLAAKRNPRVFSEKVDMTTNGESINAPVLPDFSKLSTEQLEKLLKKDDKTGAGK